MPENVVQFEQKPSVRVEDGRLHETIDDIISALADQADPAIFKDGESLIRLVDRHGRKEALAFTPHALASELTRIIRFRQVGQNSQGVETLKPKSCTAELARMVIERGDWPGVPEMNGIMNCQTIRPDGSLIVNAGYDRESGFYIDRPGIHPYPIGKQKTTASDNLDELRRLFSEYPFLTPADESALLAMLVTSIIRPALYKCPAFAATAPTPGTGKTHLCEAVMLISAGVIPPILPLSKDPMEAEKVFSAALQSRMPILFCDNIKTVINWPFLQGVLTSNRAALRVFGTTRLVSLPTNSTFIFNGNNLRISDDNVRRFLMVNLDAGCERPEQREFKRDIHGLITRNRDTYIRYALSIIAAYVDAGFPSVDAAGSGFPEWDKMVRFPLIWLGLPDPLDANKTMRADDTDTQTIAAMCDVLQRISKHLDIPHFTARQIIGLMDDQMMTTELRDDLIEALHMACPFKVEPGPVGTWLSNNMDRPVDGYRIAKVRKDKHKRHNLWIIEKVGE